MRERERKGRKRERGRKGEQERYIEGGREGARKKGKESKERERHTGMRVEFLAQGNNGSH